MNTQKILIGERPVPTYVLSASSGIWGASGCVWRPPGGHLEASRGHLNDIWCIWGPPGDILGVTSDPHNLTYTVRHDRNVNSCILCIGRTHAHIRHAPTSQYGLPHPCGASDAKVYVCWGHLGASTSQILCNDETSQILYSGETDQILCIEVQSLYTCLA